MSDPSHGENLRGLGKLLRAGWGVSMVHETGNLLITATKDGRKTGIKVPYDIGPGSVYGKSTEMLRVALATLAAYSIDGKCGMHAEDVK